jgi:hypothetical protein
MAAFHWTLLAGFALLEYAYLQALYVLARSALRHLIGA